MRCKVSGCQREATYKGSQVCQKHYFRYWRNGTYDLKPREDHKPRPQRSHKYRITNPAGYQKLYEPTHPLSDTTGYVFEHRFVYYNETSKVVDSCAICGAEIAWKTCHIDHIDCDVTNNVKSNIRATCRGCNTYRGHTATSKGKIFLTVNGVTMTAGAWSRMDDVYVCTSAILNRKERGMTDYDAIFSNRKTHMNTKTKKQKRKNDEVRGIEGHLLRGENG